MNRERNDKIEFQKFETVQDLKSLELSQDQIYDAISKLE
jgi:hypothetical protein